MPNLLPTPLRWWVCALLILGAGVGYGIAFATKNSGEAIFVALPCLFLLARVKTSRSAFYIGSLGGLAIYVPQLWFFISVFHAAAIAVWLIAALPIGLFTLLVQQTRQRFAGLITMAITPVIWTGIEFFRSELYYLRFAWVLPGQVVAFMPGLRLMGLGVYGLGFLCALSASLLIGPRFIIRLAGALMVGVLAVMMHLPAVSPSNLTAVKLHVAGVQLENPSESLAADTLDQLALAHPEAQLLVLSEYSFGGSVPQRVRDVIRNHGRYLIAGGMVDPDKSEYRDTAFVIGPDGRDLFQQGKSVPVQLMSDGLPAVDRKVWNSPWGKIGIAVCYDVSYARVMDDFVRSGACGLIIPTMDLQGWGRYEREMLHGRLAPIRAAEYSIPVFGVWSSGESQLTDRQGVVIASAGYPGVGEMIAGPFDMSGIAHVPMDRYPAAGASVFDGGLIIYFVITSRKRWKKNEI